MSLLLGKNSSWPNSLKFLRYVPAAAVAAGKASPSFLSFRCSLFLSALHVPIPSSGVERDLEHFQHVMEFPLDTRR